VGQDEEAATPVASANFSRREQSRLCAIAQAAKAGRDLGKSQIDVPFDILGEDPAWRDLRDDARDMRPQVAGIGCPAPLTSEAEGLAWITGSDDMKAAAPWSAIKGCKIVPYRRRCQGRVIHPRHESGRCMGFALDVTHTAISGLGDVQAKVEPAISGAERQTGKLVAGIAVGGICNHKISLPGQPLAGRSLGGSAASAG
jgi:hypothetical protein